MVGHLGHNWVVVAVVEQFTGILDLQARLADQSSGQKTMGWCKNRLRSLLDGVRIV